MAFWFLDWICPSCNPAASAAVTFALWPKQLLQSPRLCTTSGRNYLDLHHVRHQCCLAAVPRLLLESFGGLVGFFSCLFKVVWMPEGWKSQARRCGIVKPCWVLTDPLPPLPMNHGLQKSSTESEEGRAKIWSASFHSSDSIWITHVRLNLCFIPDEQPLVTGRVNEN